MQNNDIENLGKAAKAGLGVLARAAAIVAVATIATPIVLGVVAGAVLGAGGWAVTGVVLAGIVGGGWLGKKIAGNYVAKNSGPAIVVAGNILDGINKELTPPGGKPLDLAGLAAKFETVAATATATAEVPAAVAPDVAAPAFEKKAAPAQTL